MQKIKNPSKFNGDISFLLVPEENNQKHIEDPPEMN